MATQDSTRLAREAAAIHAASESAGHNVGALEFHDDPRDRLAARLTQVEAMLCATFGVAGDGWRALAPGVQDSYLWAAWDLVRACLGDLACLDAEHRGRVA
jgi:hypothetical protein